MKSERDHGGALNAAVTEFGGNLVDWIDLSTGINPHHYPVGNIPETAWSRLPDPEEITALEDAARVFWNVPSHLEVVASPGASALIALMPTLFSGASVHIPQPTYNEHEAAFSAADWPIATDGDVRVLVNPNNPDGKLWHENELGDAALIVDESFCDVAPDATLLHLIDRGDRVMLKSFGKFWGLAGLRLGFAICLPKLAMRIRDRLGPWQVSGPACFAGTRALCDFQWANEARKKLESDADRLDGMLTKSGFNVVGGCDLFRLAETSDATEIYQALGQHQILTRIFPYSKRWVRFGLPKLEDHWARLQRALSKLR